MCGFVAVIAPPGRFTSADLERATAAMHHRGPDARAVERIHGDGQREVWFGFARLAIVDLSPLANQPMHAQVAERDGTIVFNGEIYNHRALRSDIHSRSSLQSRSDTEVLLRGLMLDGARFLTRANGMFAFAQFDGSTNKLLVGRDRLGKKPLFVYSANGVLAFASELKAFAALGLELTVDAESMAYFRWLGYVPAERSIYSQCRKFPAGSFASVDIADLVVAPELFWDPVANLGRHFRGGYEDAIEELWSLIEDATRLRLEADVPVGLFLSGGIDSSLVATAAIKQGDVRAYVIKPSDASLDESELAVRTAQILQMEVRVLPLERTDYQAQTRHLAWYSDEPMADLSQIAVMANSQAARREVTVVLTGDGGDEVFLGYPWTQHPARLFRYASLLRSVPGAVGAADAFLSTALGKSAVRGASRILHLNTDTAGSKVELLRSTLSATKPADIYEHFHANHLRGELDPTDLALIGGGSLFDHARSWYPNYDWAAAEARGGSELLAVLDLVTYMRDEILVKVDRGTMAYSIEARSPLLDHRIVEFGLSLPASFKCSGGTSKRILRDLCARRVDARLASLRKRGFGVTQLSEKSSVSASAEWNRYVERGWRECWDRSIKPRERPAASILV